MSSWLPFFKDAGIPSPLAEKYSSLFEDNRITREMLSDLNKDILHDVGIVVVGDIIAILKYAKKIHLQAESPSTMNYQSKKPNKVIPAVTVTSTASPALEQDTVEISSEMKISTANLPGKDDEVVEKKFEVGTLHSDRMLIHEETDPLIHEEYTTSAYEDRMKRKATQPSPFKVAQNDSFNKPTNRIVFSSLRGGLEENSSGSGIQRSKRFLEAAGCFHNPTADVRSSIFSRLEIPASVRDRPFEKTSVKSRLGKRVDEEQLLSSGSFKTARLYSDANVGESASTIHSRLGEREELTSSGSDICTPTMVADTFSKHSDVHARLKKGGMTVLGTKGPLGKRLGEHAVFTRLG
ncbi:PREDICTED: uncharacterized protein C19orf47-like isoform X2 [Amphimedon queenslandica]|uniref:SAM domain-containing protein n=1 Tax=Amphimedon queenslandica TaxID=400682 RepID=A0A1X7UKK3_AMPQE|nr:PREDICTED: uncharacterized protein C19orf47-like isoform X2 [Amphimedon queenslandica]|eukprot:XP_019853713.1 PREDICTED: uncharacterized protein C19orf47-like isoform X2 [Amphimedon queenslandica]